MPNIMKDKDFDYWMERLREHVNMHDSMPKLTAKIRSVKKVAGFLKNQKENPTEVAQLAQLQQFVDDFNAKRPLSESYVLFRDRRIPWDKRYQQLRQFKEKHEKLPECNDETELGQKLYRWLQGQKMTLEGCLDGNDERKKEKANMILSLGFPLFTPKRRRETGNVVQGEAWKSTNASNNITFCEPMFND